MDSITLGAYLPLDSLIHKLDPRAKIMAMLFLVVAVFIPSSWPGYLIIALVIADCMYLSKLKINYLWKSIKPMLFMFVFLFIVNSLVVRTGDVAFSIFGLKIYSGAIHQTLYIVIRLLFMIAITTLLTATTKPLDLTLGLEDLLSPFRKIGVPSHEIAMMISIALRFIPTLIEEAQRIMKAQASRGVDMENGKFTEKIMSMLSLIVPLFISAFQRAEDLAYAMEARGYIPDKERTRYKQLKMGYKDWILMGFSVLVLAIEIMIATYPVA